MRLRTATMLALLAPLLAQAALAEPRACAPRETVVARLAEGYGERRRAVGIGANNRMIEVFASETSGSWTITETTPGGTTCLVASGQAYQSVADAVPEASEPA